MVFPWRGEQRQGEGECGGLADNALYQEILEKRPGLEVYNIGDSVVPRDTYYASHEAAEIAELIRLRVADKANFSGGQGLGK